MIEYKIKKLNNESSTFVSVNFLLLKNKQDGNIELVDLSPASFQKNMVLMIEESEKKNTNVIKILEIIFMIYAKTDLSIAPFLKKHNLVFEDFEYGDRIIKTKDEIYLVRQTGILNQ